MSEGVVAKRYARALYEIGAESQQLDAIEADLQAIVEAVAQSKEFYDYLTHPKVSFVEKKEKLEVIFSGKIQPAVYQLLLLLVERGRTETLKSLYQQFVNLANEARGIADAVVTSAAPLSESELQNVATAFGSKIGKTLRVVNKVDASIVGGVIVQIGDRLWDGSVVGQLNRFQKTLVHP
jgi:F-type H+-transporting ATPase subunit delta